MLVSHEIAAESRHWGHLGLALDAGDASADGPAQQLLSLLARTLAVRLNAAARAIAGAVARRLDRQTALADVAETAAPLTHEFNNFLNVLLLQITSLRTALPEDVRAELEQVGQQGRTAAALVRAWQRYRQQFQPVSRALTSAR